jgi:hypothetical protein
LREVCLVRSLAGGHTTPPHALLAWFEEQLPTANLYETVASWLQVREGGQYYSLLRMPSLMLIPTPVAATWSLRLEETDEHGIHSRRHYPQLRENGLHDPDLREIDRGFLASRQAVPDWLVFPKLQDADPEQLIRRDPTIASVRFVQDRDKAPSFVGGILTVGGGYVAKGAGQGFGTSVGLGFGVIDELAPLRKLPSLHRLSVEVAYQPRVDTKGRSVLSPYLAYQIKVPGLWVFHVETGYVFGLREPYKQRGARAAIGVSTRTLPLGFTYLGATIRLKYQAYYLEEIIGGIYLELVLH